MIPIYQALTIPGWMEPAALQWLRSVALSLPGGSVVVELGCWMGRSTAALAVPNISLICVDNFQGIPADQTQYQAAQRDVYAAFVSNALRYGLRVSLLYMDSLRAAELFKDRSVDMVFIDDDHTNFGRIRSAWTPKVKRGGIESGHDYGNIRFPNIRRELEAKRIPITLVNGSSVWFYRAG